MVRYRHGKGEIMEWEKGYQPMWVTRREDNGGDKIFTEDELQFLNRMYSVLMI